MTISFVDFDRKYPFMTSRLIKWAVDRLANTPAYRESEIRHTIAKKQQTLRYIYIGYAYTPTSFLNAAESYNGSINKVVDNAIINQEYDTNKVIDSVQTYWGKLSEEECQYLATRVEIEGLKRSLVDIVGKPASYPTHAQGRQAVEEVKEYIGALQSPTVNLLDKWGNRLSNIEKHHLQALGRELFGDKLINDIKIRDKVWSWYGEGAYQVLTEPTIYEARTQDYDLVFTITKNSYGVKVINAAEVLFADIDCFINDFTDISEKSLPWGMPRIELSNETRLTILNNIHAIANEYDLKFRIYETKNGFRLLETTRLWSPYGRETQVLLGQLGSDHLFNKLCFTQNCFRARLEPKPWRYDESDGYDVAVTHYLSTAGNPELPDHPLTELVYHFHDMETKAYEIDLELA